MATLCNWYTGDEPPDNWEEPIPEEPGEEEVTAVHPPHPLLLDVCKLRSRSTTKMRAVNP